MKHFNIAVFIPELACPHQCVFCDQVKISGVGKQPASEDIHATINQYLQTIPAIDREVSIAFFGGSFTGLPMHAMKEYLEMVKPYVEEGRVDYIRLSTRPDYIDVEVLKMLKEYHVKAIELGAQSTNPEVLRLSGRGHGREDIIKAAGLIKSMQFELGLQMMTGLPGDDREKALSTAKDIVSLGAATTRIYPTLVIKGTALERMFNNKAYSPQTLKEAVELSAKLYLFFVAHNVKVLRTGLHPSEGLLSGCDLVAGPFHPAFGEMVKTEAWKIRFMQGLDLCMKHEYVEIFVNEKELNTAIGHQATNKLLLKEHFRKVKFTPSLKLKGFEFYADYH